MPAEEGWVRPFQNEDAASCTRIVRACLELDSLAADLKAELLQAESAELMCARARLFYIAVFVREGGAVAGLGGLDLNEIRMLFIDPEQQRKGIGGSLLQHLEELVPPALFGDIFVYAAPGAVDFYRVHGYEPGGEHAFKVGSYAMSTIFMTKRLVR